ncbi:MAG: hypothetical protein ACRENA_05770, partial [Vulcanimicrobiaceae bacterium]
MLHAYFVAPQLQADSIYVYMLVSDVARNPHIVAWWLPPANGFFPDVVVSALGYSMGLHGFSDTAFLHAFFCLWIVVTATALLRAGGIAPVPALGAAVVALAAFDLVDPSKTLLTWTLLVPDSHEGVIGVELAGAALYLRYAAKREGWALALLFVVTAIGVFSDRIVATQFAGPIALLAALRWIVSRAGAEAGSLVAIVAGTGVGVGCVRLLDYSADFQTALIPQMLHYPFGRAQLHDVLTHVSTITGTAHAAFYAAAYLALLVLLVFPSLRARFG